MLWQLDEGTMCGRRRKDGSAPQMPSSTKEELSDRGWWPLFRQKNVPPEHAEVPAIGRPTLCGARPFCVPPQRLSIEQLQCSQSAGTAAGWFQRQGPAEAAQCDRCDKLICRRTPAVCTGVQSGRIAVGAPGSSLPSTQSQ